LLLGRALPQLAGWLWFFFYEHLAECEVRSCEALASQILDVFFLSEIDAGLERILGGVDSGAILDGSEFVVAVQLYRFVVELLQGYEDVWASNVFHQFVRVYWLNQVAGLSTLRYLQIICLLEHENATVDHFDEAIRFLEYLLENGWVLTHEALVVLLAQHHF
jgi:hypothetical protein